MKKLLLALAVLLIANLAMLSQARSQGPGQTGQTSSPGLGPTEKGSTLRQPGADSGTQSSGSAPSPGTPNSAAPAYVQSLLGQGTAQAPLTAPPGHSSLLPYDNTGINNDILVNKDMGPWMILLMSYSGPDGPMRARKLVIELRGTFKLPAFVFNYGQEEKRKELERVKAIIEKNKQFIKEENLAADYQVRVKHLRIDEHCGVLIGAYPSEEAAIKARNHIRTLKPPTPVQGVWVELLDVSFVTPDEDSPTKGKMRDAFYVNPFQKAMVVRNPCVKFERPANWDKLDINVLRVMNKVEDFSLLQCGKKKYTLAIKQYRTETRSDVEIKGAGFLKAFGLKQSKEVDPAAENAHNLAEALRSKSKIEAYVLHTTYFSLVTVGAYDSLDEPGLRAMQNLLDTRLLPSVPPGLELLPRAVPMLIPQ